MKSLLIVAVLLASSTQSHATMAPKPTPLPVHNTGAWAMTTANGIIIAAGTLAIYDILRRWTCIGDPLRLGGPGFNEPMPATGNVKRPPVCAGDPRR